MYQVYVTSFFLSFHSQNTETGHYLSTKHSCSKPFLFNLQISISHHGNESAKFGRTSRRFRFVKLSNQPSLGSLRLEITHWRGTFKTYQTKIIEF
jgi:hypothetical protein